MNKFATILIFVIIIAVGLQQYQKRQAGGAGDTDDAASGDGLPLEELVAGPGVVLVKFGATWCGPCLAMDDEIKKIAGPHEIVKIDVDQRPELAERFGITTIPHTVLFRDGEPLDQLSGFKTAQEIVDWVKQYETAEPVES